jgi:hypothetical protein
MDDLNDECFEGLQAALKYSRRFDMSTPPAALCRAPATKPPNTDDGVEQEPARSFKPIGVNAGPVPNFFAGVL